MQAINDPFMDPAKLPTVDDLQGAPVRLSYHEVRAWDNCRCSSEMFESGFMVLCLEPLKE